MVDHDFSGHGEIDDILARADKLLSFGPKQSIRPTVAKKKDDPLAWKLYTKGSFGPRVDLPSCFWNFDKRFLTNKVVHLYEPFTREDILAYDDSHSVVLHGHEIDRHCPWGLMCHLFPCTPTEPTWGFKEKWSFVYEVQELQ